MTGTTPATDLTDLSAVQLLAGYADGALDPVDVHEAVQQSIEGQEHRLNAFSARDPEQSRRAAEDSARQWAAGTPRGPLEGVPITLKENIARRGVAMQAGCAGVTPVLPEHDAPITRRVTEAGAVVLGSTVMPDWGMLSSGVSSLHGISYSPAGLTTGGSSAGAGAAAAAGFGPLHVGTDIGGSIRLPGTWLGLATLKPSAGRVPLDVPYWGRAAGPMARSVPDLALLMAVISQPDPVDWTALPPQQVDWHDLSWNPSGARIGLQLEAGAGIAVDPGIRAAVLACAEVFAAAGAEVVELPGWLDPDLLRDVDTFWRTRSLNDFDALPATGRARVLPYIADWVQAVRGVSGTRLMACHSSMLQIQQRTVEACQPFDLVLSPVAPMAAFPADWPMPWGPDESVPAEHGGMAHIGFTVGHNLSGQPAGTVACGATDDGRPIGVQVSGRRFDDLGVLRAMAWYEQAVSDPAGPPVRPARPAHPL